MLKKISLSIIIVALAVIAWRFIPGMIGDEQGSITFIVYNQTNDVLIEDSLVFEANESLFEVLDQNYDLVCASATYGFDEACQTRPMGRNILVINQIETDWFNTFFHIKINGEAAVYGVDQIALHDGDLITFTISRPW